MDFSSWCEFHKCLRNDPVCRDSLIHNWTSKAEKIRNKIYEESLKEIDKHVNESCSNCNKLIDFHAWFCYCSLCPDCYMQTPEEELEKIDKRMFELAEKEENKERDHSTR